MTRTGRIMLWTVASLIGVVAVGVAAVLVMPWDWARGPLARRLSDASGRSIAVQNLDLHLGLTSRLRADGLRIANAPWGRAGDMVDIERLEFSLSLPDLLRGRTVIPVLRLVHPRISLEKNAQGDVNWHFGNPKAAAVKTVAVPQRRSEFPVIERLEIEDGQLSYKDPGKGIDLTSRINTALGGDPEHNRVTLDGNGQLQGAPFHLAVQGGSILQLRDSRQPYPIRIDLDVGQTHTHFDGTVTEPLQLAGIDLRLRVAGQDLADVFPIFGIPVPHTPPYSLEGQLVRQGDDWSFRDFAGRVGGSDLRGSLRVAVGGPRPRMDATLTSDNLALADLGGFVGGQPGHGEAPKKDPGRVLPATPVNLDKLRAMDMDVHFQGRRIDAGLLPIDNLRVTLAIDDGRAVLDPLALGVAGGFLQGGVTLDGRGPTPAASLDLNLERLAMDKLVKNPDVSQRMSGTLGGHLQLTGQGASTADILAGANGRVSLFMGQGSFSHLVLEVMGLDVAKALGVVVSGDQPVGVRCLVADMPLRQGVLHADTLVLDTQVSAIIGEGQASLADETLDLRLLAHPKQPSLFTARAPIVVGGTFKAPTFGIDPKAEVARGTAAVALGALLTPLGALLPFIDLGLGKDSPCRQLITQAQAGAAASQ